MTNNKVLIFVVIYIFLISVFWIKNPEKYDQWMKFKYGWVQNIGGK